MKGQRVELVSLRYHVVTSCHTILVHLLSSFDLACTEGVDYYCKMNIRLARVSPVLLAPS